MDDMTSRFRSAYDSLMVEQPDPPLFEDIALPEIGQASDRRFRKPPIAFVGGVAVVAMLGLVLWLSGAWSDRLPPPLATAETNSLQWKMTETIASDFDRIVFAGDAEASLAVATSWTQGDGTSLSGVYQSEEGIRWTEIESDGFAGLDQLLTLTTTPDGYLASGLYREGGVPRPAVWTTETGEVWDRTLLPIPERDDPDAVINYGVGPVAIGPTQMFALGQFVELSSSTPDEGGPEFNDEGEQIPPDQGTFLWETDESGNWTVSDSAPSNPLFMADGPEGVVLLSAGSQGTTDVWSRTDDEWVKMTSVQAPGQFGTGIVANNIGYLIVSVDGSVWFSPDAANWSLIDIPLSEALGAGPGSTIATGSGGFLLSSTQNGQDPQIWWSVDGTEWAEIPPDDLGIDELDSISSATITGHAITMAGQHNTSGEPQGFVVTGSRSP